MEGKLIDKYYTRLALINLIGVHVVSKNCRNPAYNGNTDHMILYHKIRNKEQYKPEVISLKDGLPYLPGGELIDFPINNVIRFTAEGNKDYE